MKHLPTLIISALTTLFVCAISCNKDSNTHATTKIKCVTCANGGSCIDDSCHCPAGYEGAACETMTRNKFISSWTVTEKGTLSAQRQYSVQINSNFATGINTVQLSNFYDFYSFNYFINATVSGDSIYVPLQHLEGKIFVGAGYIHSDPTFGQYGAITMRYMVTDSITGHVDDFGYASPATGTSEWKK